MCWQVLWQQWAYTLLIKESDNNQLLIKGYIMQILLASAKIMNSSSLVEVPLMSEPTYKEQASKFALELSSWDTKHLMKELKCSQAIAQENLQRYQSFWNESEQMPAILAYFGQAYKYLKAETFSKDDFAFAQDHLFISSFLYGMLRPLDRIHPYRMEGKVKLEAANGENLFSFWKPLLTDRLIESVRLMMAYSFIWLPRSLSTSLTGSE